MSELPYREPTISDIEDAIDVVLTAYVEQRRSPVGIKRMYSASAVKLADIPAGPKAELLDILENPLLMSYRPMIKLLGQHLFDLLKTDLKIKSPSLEMLDSLHNIAARDPENESRRGAILDKLWDGVGDERWSWMA